VGRESFFMSNTLKVKEIFSTVQGEGSKAGTPAVFIRLAGCNLWSGHESARESGKGACADWCDTYFYGGTPYPVVELVDAVQELTQGWSQRMVVISGGEPLLQMRRPIGAVLCTELKKIGVTLSVETNGTVSSPVLEFFDHITLSPKPLKPIYMVDKAYPFAEWGHINIQSGTDLKVIVPTKWSDEAINEFASWNFEHKFFQPKDIGDKGLGATEHAVRLAQRHEGWRVSFQTHKFAGLA